MQRMTTRPNALRKDQGCTRRTLVAVRLAVLRHASRDGARPLVALQVAVLAAIQPRRQRLRDAGHLVEAEHERRHHATPRHAGRDGASQLVVLRVERLQVQCRVERGKGGRAKHGLRDSAGQLVVVDVEHTQRWPVEGEVHHVRGDTARQLVPAQIQNHKGGHVAKHRRDLAVQSVVAQLQGLQRVDDTNGGRQGARQAVAGQLDLGDVLRGVQRAGDAEPGAVVGARAPAGVVLPARAASCGVQVHEGSPVLVSLSRRHRHCSGQDNQRHDETRHVRRSRRVLW
mmetsp:Transcript_65217/g.132504  ORF Transcript_65217/g.132504 Transcript_65217/m.132504 type:complete len:285 (+) Transcript_65217:59-913(+)